MIGSYPTKLLTTMSVLPFSISFFLVFDNFRRQQLTARTDRVSQSFAHIYINLSHSEWICTASFIIANNSEKCHELMIDISGFFLFDLRKWNIGHPLIE